LSHGQRFKNYLTADSETNCLTGHLLENSLTPLLIGHWVAEGQVTGRCCQLQNTNASNVFPCKGVDTGRILVELVATIIEKFSFEGQWVLDLTNTVGKSHCPFLENPSNLAGP